MCVGYICGDVIVVVFCKSVKAIVGKVALVGNWSIGV